MNGFGDFLGRLAARALGSLPPVRPRLPFVAGESWVSEEAVEAPPPARDTASARPRPVETSIPRAPVRNVSPALSPISPLAPGRERERQERSGEARPQEVASPDVEAEARPSLPRPGLVPVQALAPVPLEIPFEQPERVEPPVHPGGRQRIGDASTNESSGVRRPLVPRSTVVREAPDLSFFPSPGREESDRREGRGARPLEAGWGRSAAEASEPTIRVTIGRIEVRATTPAPPPAPAARPAGPRLTLEEYLRRRREGRM